MNDSLLEHIAQTLDKIERHLATIADIQTEEAGSKARERRAKQLLARYIAEGQVNVD